MAKELLLRKGQAFGIPFNGIAGRFVEKLPALQTEVKEKELK